MDDVGATEPAVVSLLIIIESSVKCTVFRSTAVVQLYDCKLTTLQILEDEPTHVLIVS